MKLGRLDLLSTPDENVPEAADENVPPNWGVCRGHPEGLVIPGVWHVMTRITWNVADAVQGGALLATTEVEEGGAVDLVLSH